jgi:hypothetical protein
MTIIWNDVPVLRRDAFDVNSVRRHPRRRYDFWNITRKTTFLVGQNETPRTLQRRICNALRKHKACGDWPYRTRCTANGVIFEWLDLPIDNSEVA